MHTQSRQFDQLKQLRYGAAGLSIAAGLISFLSPCVLPLVPAYVGYLGGRTRSEVSYK